MKCAIYARKCTDDCLNGRENKSVTKQVEEAINYINYKGWKVLDNHIYVDDGIHGIKFNCRPSFHRLFKNIGEFDCLVMWEYRLFNRNIDCEAVELVEILLSDVRIFYYQTDEEEKMDNPDLKKFLDQFPELQNGKFRWFNKSMEGVGFDYNSYYNDDGIKFDPNLITTPDLCINCKHDYGFQKIICRIRRADQRGESTFRCDDYKK